MVGLAIVGNVIGGVGLVTALRLMQMPHKVIGERDDDGAKT
jgi:formate-nitrite transporter family protein